MKNGVVTVLSNLGANEANKVIDTQVLTSFCHVCKQLGSDRTKPSTIANDHDCRANHEGAAGKMESDGALQIFQRSLTKHNLRCTEYLDDRDLKAYAEVLEAKVYGKNVDIYKLQSNGHIQKRMGKGFMNVVTENKDKVFIVNRDGILMTTKTVVNQNRNEKLYRGAGGTRRLTSKTMKHDAPMALPSETTGL